MVEDGVKTCQGSGVFNPQLYALSTLIYQLSYSGPCRARTDKCLPTFDDVGDLIECKCADPVCKGVRVL